MAETLETKREGGARTRVMPMRRKKERVATCIILETASLTGCRKEDVSDALLVQRHSISFDDSVFDHIVVEYHNGSQGIKSKLPLYATLPPLPSSPRLTSGVAFSALRVQ